MTTELMNFRVPSDIRSSFNSICKMKHTTMTRELVSMMMEFIDSEGEQVLDNYQKYRDFRSKVDQIRDTKKSRDYTSILDFGSNTPGQVETTVQKHGNYVLDPISNTWMTETDWNSRR
jgi:hypothetical protein